MAYDSHATRARILEAAYREFAAYGLAGARIDRIAANAKANKRAIYEYFGKKEDLFDQVVTERLELSVQAVSASWDDLPQLTVDVFDYYASDPDRMRLTLWRQLERPAPVEREVDHYRESLEAMAEGGGDRAITDADLYAVIWAIHHVRVLTPLALQLADSGAPWSKERWQQVRDAALTSVSRIVREQSSAS
ncbi:TetR family transcriptional regulator [Streptomyces sp. NPDC046977]|uniref:TetR/AcrR family transcriptional regulator n=1 Tax=Streptomyces sp. NPDC046977 TaxID=3154703 RepID=UPI00340283F1